MEQVYTYSKSTIYVVSWCQNFDCYPICMHLRIVSTKISILTKLSQLEGLKIFCRGNLDSQVQKSCRSPKYKVQKTYLRIWDHWLWIRTSQRPSCAYRCSDRPARGYRSGHSSSARPDCGTRGPWHGKGWPYCLRRLLPTLTTLCWNRGHWASLRCSRRWN